MNAGDLLTPWLMLAAVLVPLVLVEHWIHSHLYGVGWLLTNDNRSATILYYVLLFPGVFVHETVQWLVAGALRVDIKRIRVWPDVQKDGTLRLDFVQIKPTNKINTAIIGAAPFVVGLALVWIISNYILNLDALLSAIGARDLQAISAAIRQLARTPDFYLWLYLLFAISNAMLPTPADRQGWSLILILIAAAVVFLIVIGTGDQLLRTYRESILVGVEHLTTAFATLLVVEIPAMLVIGLCEEVLERITRRKFMYRNPRVTGRREPGSPEPLAPGEPRPSIYLLELPVPLPPDRPKPRRAAVSASGRSAPGITPPGPDSAAASPRSPVQSGRPVSATPAQRIAPAGTASPSATATPGAPMTASAPLHDTTASAPSRSRLSAMDTAASTSDASLRPGLPDTDRRPTERIPSEATPPPGVRSFPLSKPETGEQVEGEQPLPRWRAASDRETTLAADDAPPGRSAPATGASSEDDEDDYLGSFRQFSRRQAPEATVAGQRTRPIPPPSDRDSGPERPTRLDFTSPTADAPEAEEPELEYIPFDDIDAEDAIEDL